MGIKRVGSLEEPAVQAALADELCQLLAAEQVFLATPQRLSGGAIQENWALDASVQGGPYAGNQQWVLRTDAPSSVGVSMGRDQEFAVLERVVRAGVVAPQPVLNVAASQALQRPFFLMQRLSGLAAGYRLTRQLQPAELLQALAHSLARLHSIEAGAAQLEFLPPPAADHARTCIAEYRAYLDTLDEPQPVLEWGLRWCELHLPAPLPPVLIHRDFRTGNYLVDQGRLTAILDWEFTGLGDPREDLGWFSARCWRFSAPELEAGGVGILEDFLLAYTQAGGIKLQPEELLFWQVLAHLRWAVIALQQAQRHISGQEQGLELALTGRLLPDLEMEILHLTGG